jgi:hypothetical protein
MTRRIALAVRSLVAVLAAVLMVAGGVALPAQAASDVVVSGHVFLGTSSRSATAGEVTITIIRGGWPDIITTTDASGNYTATINSVNPNNHARVKFTNNGTGDFAGGYWPGVPLGTASSTMNLRLDSAAIPNVDMTLAAPTNVSGQVLLGGLGEIPLAGEIRVNYQRQNDNDSGLGPKSSVLAAAGGNWTIPSLPGGNYVFTYDYLGSRGYVSIDTETPGLYAPVMVYGTPVTRPTQTMWPDRSISGTVTLYPSGATAGPGDVLITWEYREDSHDAWVPAAGQSVTTDSMGQYVILGLTAPGYYRISRTWQGAGTYTGGIGTTTLFSYQHQVTRFDFTMQRLGSISGTVQLGGSGGPAPAGSVRVTVGVRFSTSTSVLVTSGGAWTVSGLSVGDTNYYYVKAEYLGTGPYSDPVDLERVTIGANNDTTGINIVLADSGFSGTVVGTADEPLEGAEVDLYAFYRSGPHVGEFVMSDYRIANAAGHFNFGQMPTDYVYILEFRHPGYAIQTWYDSGEFYEPELIFFDQGESQNGFFVTMYRSGTITGTITNLLPETLSAGRASVELLVFDWSTSQWVGTGYAESVQPNGTFALTDLSPDSYRYRLTVDVTGVQPYTSPTLDLTEAQTITFDRAVPRNPPDRITERHLAMGGESGVLGAATSAIGGFGVGQGGSIQHFANGTIYSSVQWGTFVVMAGPIRDQYFAANTIFGAYGWPLSDVECVGATCNQAFEGGTITVQQTTVSTSPVITGSPMVGGALKVSTGSYNPAATSFSYAWLRNGAPIPGANGAGYVPIAADLGQVLTAEVTARSASGLPVTAMASPTAPIAPSAAMAIAAVAAANSTQLGVATSAVVAFPDHGGGSMQHFANGSIYSSPSGTYIVMAGPIREGYWAANSIFGVYGWPTSAADCTAACTQSFQGGSITVEAIQVTVPPAITGSLIAGNVVVVSKGTYAGPTPTGYAYAWFRDGVKIAGATAASYTTVLADVGHALTATVTVTRPGSLPTTTTTVPTASIAPTAAMQITALYAANGGSAGALGVATSGIVAFPNAGGGSLQHFANGSIYSSNLGGTWVVMAGPIREQYWGANSIFGIYGWPSSALSCSSGTCTQSYTGSTGAGATLTSTQTQVTTPPSITGIPMVGGSLSVSKGTYLPAATAWSYAWFRDGVRIAGATAQSYTPVAADQGHTLTVEETARSAIGMPVASTSAATAAVLPSAAAQITALYATNGGSAGALGVATSGIVAFPNAGGGSLQHFANGSIYSSNLGGTWVVMAGPIREQYWAANSIFGVYGWPSSELSCAAGTCTQSYTGPTGAGATLTSSQTQVTSPPTITGIPMVGAPLTATKGVYDPVATAWSYAWFRDGVRIAGATAQTYTPVAADLGKALTVEVTARSATGMPVAALSAATASVAPSAATQIANTYAANGGSNGALGAAVSGVAAFADNGGGSLQHFANGSIYSSNVSGTWVVWAGPIRDAYWAANSIFGSYKWPSGEQVCPGPGCTQTFTGGTISADPLMVTTAPAISGDTRVGGILSASSGVYNPVATSFTYAWFRDGARIAGASAPSYTLVAADQTHTITVQVTASKTGKVSVTTASAPTAAIGASAVSQITALRAANSALGAAVSAAVAFPDNGGGTLQHFQNGSIYSSALGGTWIVWAGAIRTQYWNANSIFGAYRWPSGERVCTTSCTQPFTGTSPITGAN